MKLHLVLHGLFAAVMKQKDQIDLWLPHFPAHSYEWENWGQHSSQMSGAAVIHDLRGGLRGGSAASVRDLDPTVNTVLQHCPLLPPSTSLHCTIRLPFPERLRSMRKVCRNNAKPFYTGPAVQYMNPAPDQIAMVHVFEYEITDIDKVQYEGHAVIPDPACDRVSLHIWADESRGLHPPTPPTPVEQTVKMVTGLGLQQAQLYWNRTGALDPNETHPAGMQYCELYTRYERVVLGWGCDDWPHVHGCDQAREHSDAKIVHCMAVFIYNA